MKLYDFLSIASRDYDIFDDVYDTSINMFAFDEYTENDDYKAFCVELSKKVKIIKISGDTLIAGWTKMIERNMEKFRLFTAENWMEEYQFEDDDEFIYQWITQLERYIAGYVSEDFYSDLLVFAQTLK